MRALSTIFGKIYLFGKLVTSASGAQLQESENASSHEFLNYLQSRTFQLFKFFSFDNWYLTV